jgi:hypothetical protein
MDQSTHFNSRCRNLSLNQTKDTETQDEYRILFGSTGICPFSGRIKVYRILVQMPAVAHIAKATYVLAEFGYLAELETHARHTGKG